MTKLFPLYIALVAIGSCSFGATQAWAQADFRAGYIVRPTGDTVRGQVNYRGSRQEAAQCLFRPAKGSEVIAYAPAELRGYGLSSGEQYISQVTPMDSQPAAAFSNVAPLPTASTEAAPRAMFLRVLVAGPAFLLLRHDNSGNPHYYVLKQGAALASELVQKRQPVLVDGVVRREQLLPVFRGTLTEQFADCPAVLLGVSKTEFKESALIATVEQYNRCRQPDYRAASKKRQTEVALEGLVGGQISRTAYRDHDLKASLPGALSPELGLALRVSRRLADQKISVRAELHYVQQVAAGIFQKETALPAPGQVATATYETRFKAAYLRLPLLVRYTAPGTKLRPFIEAGFSFNYATTLDPQIRQVSSTIAGGSTEWHQIFDDNSFMKDPFKNYELGYIAGLGVRFRGVASHPISILARVEKNEGFMSYVDWGTPIVRGSLLLSIDLTKAKAN